ncbi:DUF1109 domain-containing protein [Pacificimonas sp. WHA3]|uniref:DUF1109 domain-containing protein n=1 Tax=Pacificimonas pallii TaxID=2827236 RepID=A0ABS6SEE7_9SPHN|nr:DUF1109 domain-containing protein [Pacificimonas pallii]MBV7256635.1 DUF1109 domain-containing protein [Pacificimonas pallii]
MSNDLLDKLVADAAPVRRANAVLFAALFSGGIAIAAASILIFYGLRDLPATTFGVSVMIWKAFASVAVAATGAVLVYRLGKPGRGVRGGTDKVFALIALLFAAPLVIAFFAGPESHKEWLFNGAWVLDCMRGIGMATVPVWTASVIWMRKAAPTDIAQASWAVGLASAASGTSAFVLYCPFDSVLYVGLWYMATILGIACVSRFILPGVIRW